jgi:hypothetical protein
LSFCGCATGESGAGKRPTTLADGLAGLCAEVVGWWAPIEGRWAEATGVLRPARNLRPGSRKILGLFRAFGEDARVMGLSDHFSRCQHTRAAGQRAEGWPSGCPTLRDTLHDMEQCRLHGKSGLVDPVGGVPSPRIYVEACRPHRRMPSVHFSG